MAGAPADTLYVAIIRGELDTVKRMVRDGVALAGISPQMPDLSALHFAIEQRQTAIARFLIENGADLNCKTTQFGFTPLILAANKGNADAFRAAIAAGADIHATDNNGWTALDHASRYDGSVAGPMVEAAIKAGADANRVSTTWGSPLIKACWSGHVLASSALLANGARVNMLTASGTPLFQAVKNKRMDVIKVLLAGGADPNLRFIWETQKSNGQFVAKTPLEFARERNLTRIVALLEDPAAAKSATDRVAELTADDVPALWTKLEAALSKAAEGGNADLAGPATVKELADLEIATGLKLPDDIKASYFIHNGQDESADGIYAPGGFLDGTFFLMSVEQILGEWSMWKNLVDGGEFRGQESAPGNGVRSDWWSPGWLPILSDGGGDSLCVDLSPATTGVPGQIIKMSHDSPKRPLLAPSFAAFLAQLTDQWETQSETGPK